MGARPHKDSVGVALGISASGKTLSLALRRRDGEIVAASGSAASQRGGGLAPAVARLFVEAGLDPRDLAEIRIDLGPGSYTGLRVAVTFARTAAEFRGVSLRSATSVELLALAAWKAEAAPRDRPLTVVLDARRARFHVARLRLGSAVSLDEQPRALDLDALSASLRNGERVLADPRVQESLRSATKEGGLRLIDPVAASASDLFDGALATRAAGIGELNPLYLMGTYAD